MTDDMMTLRGLFEKARDADLLRDEALAVLPIAEADVGLPAT